jgi:hypothetical protein
LLFVIDPETQRTDFIMAILIGMLLIPKNYYGIDPKVPLGVILNPLLAIALSIVVGRKYIKKKIMPRGFPDHDQAQ